MSKQKVIGLTALFILLFMLTALFTVYWSDIFPARGPKNTVTLTSDVDTPQLIYLRCEPKSLDCPEHLPKGDTQTYQRISSLTVVSHSHFIRLNFAKGERYTLSLSQILKMNPDTEASYACKSYHVGGKDHDIDCKTNKPIPHDSEK